MSHGSVKTCLQCATCSLVSGCLLRALKYLSRKDSRIRAEARNWPQGKTLRLEVPGAAGFTITGTKDGFQKLPKDTQGDVTIRFKSRRTPSGFSPGSSAWPGPTPSTSLSSGGIWGWPCPSSDVSTWWRGISSPPSGPSGC